MIIKFSENRVTNVIDDYRFTRYNHEDKIIYYNGNISEKITEDFRIESYDFEEAIKDIFNAESEKQLCDILLRLNGKYSFIMLKDKEILWVSTDIAAINRLYFYQEEGCSYIFDDFNEFKNKMNLIKNISINKENFSFFKSKGYNPPGKTHIENLYKSIPGYIHYFHENKKDLDIMKFYNFKFEFEYETFKKIIDNQLSVSCKSYDNIYLLLSGGVDSNLLLSIMKKLNIKCIPITAKYRSEYQFASNYNDIEKSKYIVNKYYKDITHKIVDVKIDKKTIVDTIKLYKKVMPFESHLAVIFRAIFEEISSENQGKKTLVICGQNADTLYLGPTERIQLNPFHNEFKHSIFSMIARFLLSKYFLKLKRSKRLVHWILSKVLYIGKGKRYILPQNEIEVMNYFLNSPNYLAAIEKDREISHFDKEDDFSFMQSIYLNKVRSFMDGRDPKVVYASGQIFNIDVLLPFSTPIFVYFFYKMTYDINYILKPKDFLYRYLKENGIDIEKINIKHNKGLLTLDEFEAKLLSLFERKEESVQQFLGEAWNES